MHEAPASIPDTKNTANKNINNNISNRALLKVWLSQAPVAHTCNSSYSGGRDQKDCGSKPVQGKKGLVEWLKM
jgi:hypothetical protein